MSSTTKLHLTWFHFPQKLGVVPPQKQDSALLLAELHEVPASLFPCGVVKPNHNGNIPRDSSSTSTMPPDRMAFSALYYVQLLHLFYFLFNVCSKYSSQYDSVGLRIEEFIFKPEGGPSSFSFHGEGIQKASNFHPVFSVPKSRLLEHANISTSFQNTSLVHFIAIWHSLASLKQLST